MELPTPNVDELHTALDAVMPGDRFRFRRALRRAQRDQDSGRSVTRALQQLARQIDESAALRERRRESIPRLTYDEQLPITARRKEIIAAIEQHPVVIVCGDTGSGKSTQLPKICLEAGRGVDGTIGHTQPRRLAARTVAARIADELDVPLGQFVGYKMRFTDETRPETCVKVMTDGILLAETQADRFLDRYDTLIIDEAHERSLNIDFLLGYIQQILPRRPDLRVIITSATLEAARFQHHFASRQGPAPLIQVTGRTYPVEVLYRPPAVDEDQQPDVPRAIQQAVEELMNRGPGDILVFLPTERDIRETAQNLRGWATRGRQQSTIEILPLYARLSAAEQQRAFAQHAGRRIVLATNVAESSLTVPGVRMVVDTGTARVRRYSPRAKVERLPIEPISRASAEQRKGRCGRLGPGICIRLYDEQDFESREAYAAPEIRRTNLASVILQTMTLRLGPVEQFPFLDPPRPEALRDGYRTLFELGAINEHRQLTAIGRAMGKLPVDPRIGRMILAAEQQQCLHEVLIIAAGLATQDPRERPAERRDAADEAQRQWADDSSDFISYLKLWDFFHQLRETLSRQQLRKACSRNFLSLARLREWSETYRQLRRLAEQSGRKITPRRDDRAAIHQALLTGMLSAIAFRSEAYEYTGADGAKMFLWPGSSVFAKRPKWIMAAEIVETTKRYARTLAAIDPQWIEPLASHLVERRYVAPFWSRKRGAALVYEKVSLFGLPIVSRRPVRLSTVDPDAARRIFIEEALVKGNCAINLRFLQHNRRLLVSAMRQAAKSRRTDWIIAESAQMRYYDERLPREIVDLSHLRRWLPRAERDHPDLLKMRIEDFFPDRQTETPQEEFPDKLQLHDMQLPLEYTFDPGGPADGITVTLPLRVLNEVRAEDFQWLVPGRLEEKIIALIRTLPKPLRRCLVPVPDTARQVAAEMPFGEGPFLRRLAKRLEERAGEHIAADEFRLDELPAHLRMNFRIVNDEGQHVAAGRDLDKLVEQCRQAQQHLGSLDAAAAWQRGGLTHWDFGELPESLELDCGGVHLRRYPTLIDQGDSVSLALADSPAAAREHLRSGVRRLIVFSEFRELRAQVAWLPRLDEIRQFAAQLPSAETPHSGNGGPAAAAQQVDIEQQLMDLLAERAYLRDEDVPRNQEQFQDCRQAGRQRLAAAVQEVTGLVYAVLAGLVEAKSALQQNQSELWREACDDVAQQIERLAPHGFLATTPWQWLQQYPRYLQAIVYRFERLRSGALARDRRAMIELRPYLELYEQLQQEHRELQIDDPQLSELRWAVEEFRVSLFAQPLGTSMPVSAKRLDKQFAAVRR